MATYGCADNFLPGDSKVQAVGVSSMVEFKEQVKTDPRLCLQLLKAPLPEADKSSDGEGEASGTPGGEVKGETSQGGRSEGGAEETVTAIDSTTSPELALTRLVMQHLTSSLKIHEELGGRSPGRIIVPHRSGPRSNYSLAFMLLSLLDRKTENKRSKNSFLQRASHLLSGTFDGGLPAGKTAKDVSAGLDKLVKELVDRVEGRELSVGEGESSLWIALYQLSMVLPEIGDFVSYRKQGTPTRKDSVPDVFRVKASAASFPEGMLDSLKRLSRGGDPFKGVLRSPGDYLYAEVDMEDFVLDWLLPWKAQLGSSKEKYIVSAITYKQHIDGAANPHMTADVLLWEGQIVYLDTKAKTKKASIHTTFKYEAPSASDKRDLVKRGPFNTDRITFPAVAGLLFVKAQEEEEEAEEEEMEEEGRGGGSSGRGNRQSLEEGGWGERGGRRAGTQRRSEEGEAEQEEDEGEGGGGGKGKSKRKKKQEEEEGQEEEEEDEDEDNEAEEGEEEEEEEEEEENEEEEEEEVFDRDEN